MRQFRVGLFVLSIIGLGAIISSCTSIHQTLPGSQDARYKVAFNTPSQWELYSSETDPKGYFKMYRPVSSMQHKTSAQTIAVNFGHDTFTVDQSMQKIMKDYRSSNCVSTSARILARQQNSLTFTTLQKGCDYADGKLWAVHKLFSTDDGYYTITYAADPQAVSQAVLKNMQTMVATAQIVPK